MNYKYTNKDSDTYPENVVNLHIKPIENVKIFRYLGDDIKYDEPSTGDAEVNLRIVVAEGKLDHVRLMGTPSRHTTPSDQ